MPTAQPPPHPQNNAHPFYMIGDRRAPCAALLIHGFLGTPAEMRPLAFSLNRVGWTAQGLSLNGFGGTHTAHPKSKTSDWLEAVEVALANLQLKHHPTLVIGHSLGAALAISVAARLRPSGLILYNPSAHPHVDDKFSHLLPVLKYIIPQVNPARFFKIDTPRAQKNAPISTALLDQVRALGQMAGKSAPFITIPTLIIQGEGDTLLSPNKTKALIKSMTAAPVTHHQLVDGQHLLDPSSPTWSIVESLTLNFAAHIENNQAG